MVKQVFKTNKILKMKTKKLNFAEVKNALSRNEMKQIMAGSASGDGGSCTSDADCTAGMDINCNGTWIHSGPGRCYNSGTGTKCHYSVSC